MAAGACQKNIAQPTITSLPIPEVLLSREEGFREVFDEYEHDVGLILEDIAEKKELSGLKARLGSRVIDMILEFS